MKILNKKSRKQKTLVLNWDNVIRIIFILAIFVAIAIVAISCKAKQPIVTESSSVYESSIEKDKLTPVAIPGENASLKAQFECDSLNNVLLKNFNELKSKNMASAFSFANGQLDYNAQTKPDTVFVKSTDYRYYVNRRITTTITHYLKVPVEVHVHDFIWWIGLVVFIGGILFGIYKILTKTKLISFIKTILKIK